MSHPLIYPFKRRKDRECYHTARYDVTTAVCVTGGVWTTVTLYRDCAKNWTDRVVFARARLGGTRR